MATHELPTNQHPAPAGVRILVVDDDPRIRRIISNAISRIGFHVFTADDGVPAVKLAEQTPPDLALVDFHMPTPGIEVIRKLKQMYGASVWVAVLSGQDDEDMRSTCFAAGADDVLAKPVMIAELKRRVLAAARNQQAYVESRLAQERADRLLAYGAEAAAMLAHDLNNGLAVALSNMTYLHGVVQLGEDETQALTSTVNALRRMSGLVANFVDIARFEDAAVKPQAVATNVRALVHEVIDVHSAIPDRAVHYEVDCDPAMVGYFDVALIERVLHNLVGNASRYCSRDGTIRISARVWNELDPTSCEVRVFNTGPCIPEHMRGKLFAKYAKGQGGKRGFGLYFCRLACEAHGGAIEYQPSDAGSAFVLRLPGQG
ncbi:MAG TPA: response regulator [Kofleriaceae bacterium]|nr:response regulator [Kofleriaceae bacterium]